MTNYSERKMLELIHREKLVRLETALASMTDVPARDALHRRIADESKSYATMMAKLTQVDASDE